MKTDLYIGVLSGTSMDSVDAAIFSFPANNKFTLIASHSKNIPGLIRSECLEISHSSQSNINLIGKLDNLLGNLFADTVKELLTLAKLKSCEITAIGSHGQTVKHNPESNTPFSIQLADPNIIAEQTKITTIADFRRKDIAAGGQGAPLAPGFHAAMFQEQDTPIIVINIGGISNASFLPAKSENLNIIGFDLGPGNCLIDYWCQEHFNCRFDENGAIAAKGKIIPTLLNDILNDPFFAKSSPKTTGLEYFNPAWLKTKLSNMKCSPVDILTTLTALTSKAIATAIPAKDAKVYLCGGGAFNKTLVNFLTDFLGKEVYSTSQLGISPKWVEAGLFAWLAQQCLLKQPANIPSVTGAKNKTVLGGVFYS